MRFINMKTKRSARETFPGGFLNADLDIEMSKGFDEWLNAVDSKVIVLRRTDPFAVLELNKQPKSIDGAIASWAVIIAALPPRLKKMWHGAKLRRVNIGITGNAPQQVFGISEKSVQYLSRMSADLVFTVYCPPA